MNWNSFIKILQITSSILLIIAVLLQGKHSSLSNLFGGDGSFYATRRGAERFLFIFTIILAFMFAGSILIDLILL
ncbi:preprotein translocase subunit SecG [Patescibacteria group bacterium]|nr:preprotein translocase subunit SecG [Patescibacteria group bacterium]